MSTLDNFNLYPLVHAHKETEDIFSFRLLNSNKYEREDGEVLNVPQLFKEYKFLWNVRNPYDQRGKWVKTPNGVMIRVPKKTKFDCNTRGHKWIQGMCQYCFIEEIKK